jgi:hypothetical protein
MTLYWEPYKTTWLNSATLQTHQLIYCSHVYMLESNNMKPILTTTHISFLQNLLFQMTKLFSNNNIYQLRLFRIISILSKFVIFVRQITWFRWNVRHWTSGDNVHNKNYNRYVPFQRYMLNLNKSLHFL